MAEEWKGDVTGKTVQRPFAPWASGSKKKERYQPKYRKHHDHWPWRIMVRCLLAKDREPKRDA